MRDYGGGYTGLMKNGMRDGPGLLASSTGDGYVYEIWSNNFIEGQFNYVRNN